MWDFLYVIVMAMIRVWKMFTWVVIKLIEGPMRRHIRTLFGNANIKLVHDEDSASGNVKEGDKTKNNVIAKNGHGNPVKANPWDIQVHDPRFYFRLAQDGSLGLGEMYMEGWWDCDKVDELFTMLLGNGLYKALMYPWNSLIHYLQFDLFNLQTSKRAYEVGEKHYDQGNAMFQSFLDPTMNYSCGYWKDAKNLTEAQQHKMELIGKKLKLKPGMRVLDIGCGWGGLAKFLAETHKVQVVGVTISVEGAKVAQERCRGLPVEIRVQDYRELNEKFDRIVSVGMFEHVGHRNYAEFFQVTNRCLETHGIFLLHTIGVDNDDVPSIEPWFNTYIFPNGILPHHTHVPEKVTDIFTIEDLHNFGNDYNKTLMAWHANFVQNWPTIKHLYKDPQKFYRMWTYYLLISAGGFRSRRYQLWQYVLSKRGVPGGYVSVR